MNIKTRRKLTTFCYHFFCIALAVLMIYPVLWLVSSSLKDKTDIFGSLSLIPQTLHPENYANGWKGFGGISFLTFFKNSLITSVSATVLSVLGSAFVAYGFARIRFRGRSILFACMMMTLMLPAQILMVPQYLLYSKLNWINTFLPLIVPYIGGQAFFIYLCMQFINSIPRELDESARIDGCSHLQIFRYIILPLIKPALITSTIFSFYWRWSDLVGPLLVLKKPSMYTVSLALKLFSDPTTVTDWGAMFAMSALSILPDIVIFVLLQRHLVEGISTTGIKG